MFRIHTNAMKPGYNEHSVITNNNEPGYCEPWINKQNIQSQILMLLRKSIRLKRTSVITNPGYNEPWL